jgi:macrolide transport system ATP-binding/permease protein
MVGELLSDVRYALRQMRPTPTVTLVITATLANTAMFSLVDAVLLKTLPVPHPEQLQQLSWVARRYGFSTSYNGRASRNAGGERVATSFAYPVIASLRDRTTTFSDVFCFAEPQPLSVGLQGGSQLVESQFVSGNFFRGLAVDACRGRSSECGPAADPISRCRCG